VAIVHNCVRSWDSSNVDIVDFSIGSGGRCKAFLGCTTIQTVSPSSSTTPTTSTVSSSAENATQCALAAASDKPSQQLAAFNGIFLNDFTTSLTSLLFSKGQSYGPIAVRRDLYAPGYQVSEKSNLTQCVTAPTGFQDYGLVVGGNIAYAGTPSVRGDANIVGSGSANIEDSTCKLEPSSSNTFDFTNATTSYRALSQYLARLHPDLKMDTTKVLSSIGTQADPQYHILTLNSCNGPYLGCFGTSFGGDNTNLLSYAPYLISQFGQYDGLATNSSKWPTDATLVINASIFLTCILNGCSMVDTDNSLFRFPSLSFQC
jgi:choice-of-anchor A domain-containing protein